MKWYRGMTFVLCAALTAINCSDCNCADYEFSWSRVNIGGGGHNSSITPHPAVPGMVFAAQDVSGCYRLVPGSDQWQQLLD